jgi:ADP-ribose pyrophosphatase YjhB (NUDIX family)
MTRRKRPEIKFAPREVFQSMLEYGVIPTFDLIVEMPGRSGIVLVRRTIAPYAGKWALPGLRMFKPESIEDVICRIAEDELGIEVDVDNRRFVGQYVGRFRTERQRQDLSTGYVVTAFGDRIRVNREHFSGHQIIKEPAQVPASTGAMYRHYLDRYFDRLAVHGDN